MPSQKRRAEEPLLPLRAPKLAKTVQYHPNGGNSTPTQYLGLAARWIANAATTTLLALPSYFTMVKATFAAPPPSRSRPQRTSVPVARPPPPPATPAEQDRTPAASLPSPSPSPHTSPTSPSASLPHVDAGPSRHTAAASRTSTELVGASTRADQQPQSSRPDRLAKGKSDLPHAVKHSSPVRQESVMAASLPQSPRVGRTQPQPPRPRPSNEHQRLPRDSKEAQSAQTQRQRRSKSVRADDAVPPAREARPSETAHEETFGRPAPSARRFAGRTPVVDQQPQTDRMAAAWVKKTGTSPPQKGQTSSTMGSHASKASRRQPEAGPSNLPPSLLPRKDALAQQAQPTIVIAGQQSKGARLPTQDNIGLPTPPSTQASSRSSATAEVTAITRSHPEIGEALARYSRSKESALPPIQPRKYKNREHIHMKRFKRTVKEQTLEGKEEMVKYLFKLRQKKGFRSDLNDFRSLLQYEALLERNTVETLPVRGRIFVSERDNEVSPDFLERAIERAKNTLQTPAVKPYIPITPALDKVRSARRARDEAIEQKLRPVKRIPTSLPPEDEAAVDELLAKRGVISKCVREQVTDQDLLRLRPSTWLNDEIINFYGQMLLSRAEQGKENPRNGKKPLKVHYFNSFFWSKLVGDGYERARLAKWTKKFDLFEKDVVLIPVNHSNTHWTAAAINFRKKRIESYDSMGSSRPAVFKLLRFYLDAEHRNKKNKPFDFTGWEDYTMPNVPLQENGYDCGVFTCQFLESLSRGEEQFAFDQTDMPYLRRKMIWEIGHAQLREEP